MVDKNEMMAHAGFHKTFGSTRLSLGLFMPIESYSGDTPSMEGQDELAVQAEKLGFSTLWFRDVPLHVPAFGDVGQIYDPFTYLGWIAAKTKTIALATGALVLPLRHPLHTAKAAASLDILSNNRFIAGVSSGDRPEEFPSFGVDMASRGAAFRKNLSWMRSAWGKSFPLQESSEYGELKGDVDPIPKPKKGTIPVMVVGGSQQDIRWTAEHGDAWIMYPRSLTIQNQIVQSWRNTVAEITGGHSKPFGQSLYIDLLADPDAPGRPIHLGYSAGRNYIIKHLRALELLGVNHVILNLKYGSRPAKEVIQEIGEFVIPEFSVKNEEEVL